MEKSDQKMRLTEHDCMENKDICTKIYSQFCITRDGSKTYIYIFVYLYEPMKFVNRLN